MKSNASVVADDNPSHSRESSDTQPEAEDARETQGRRALVAKRDSLFATSALVWLVVPLVAIVAALPWFVEDLIWCGWLGVSGALVLTAKHKGSGGFLIAFLFSLIALSAAFYWAPAAMAYSMSSSYLVGLLMCIPLFVWDALRVACTLWLAVRLTANPRFYWLAAGLLAIIFETWLPIVFPWRMGYIQLAWPWTIQAVDLFGPGWSTLVAYAHIGVVLALGCGAHEYLHNRQAYAALLKFITSPALVFCVVNLGYGYFAVNYWQHQIETAPKMSVALVQVDPMFVDSVDKSRRSTASVAEQADLVCWPESMGGTYDMVVNDFSDESFLFQHSRSPAWQTSVA